MAATPDGEDTAGRARLRKTTPEELVSEAVTTADLAVEEFRRRGWMIPLPEVKELEKD